MIDVQRFYGLSENPFPLDPDPKFFFDSESHREALASLLYAISYRKGFTLLLADAGLGKTELLRYLISRLNQRVRTIYFPQVQISFLSMLKEILTRLNLHPEIETKGAMVHSLYSELIECQGRQETVVLILDGAESIRLDLLEEVRLLANLETGSSKLLQIVLAGRPELGKKLQSNIVRQIQQRISVKCRLQALTTEESRQYIEHRLKIAGRTSSAVFTDQAMNLICKSAHGVPARINILCSNALMMGYCRSEKKISTTTVKKIRHEKGLLTRDASRSAAIRAGRRRIGKIVFSALLVILLGLGIFFGKDSIRSIIRQPGITSSVAPAIVPEPLVVPELEKPAPAAPINEPADRPAPPDTPSDANQPTLSAKSPTIADKAEKPRSTASPPVSKDILPQIEVKKIVEVPKGSNLSLLTLQSYRMVNETLMDHILKLNPEITNPHILKPRQKIKIPELTEALLLISYPPHSYSIHLRTFEDLPSAKLYKRIAAAWTKDIEIVPLKVSAKETWYRVMAGPFTGKDKALQAVGEIKQKGFSLIPARDGK